MNLIDRDKLIEEIKEDAEGQIFWSATEHDRDDEKREFAIDKLLSAPVVEPLRFGYWIIKEDHGVYTVCSCCDCYTQCGADDEEENNRLFLTTNWCPHCGAWMDGTRRANESN